MSPVLPEIEVEIKGVKYARAFSLPRSSLAEALPSMKSLRTENYIEFASGLLRQAADRFKIDIEQEGGAKFVEVLAAEMDRSKNLPENAAQAILVVLKRRLSAIREAAIDLFETGCRGIVEGKTFLKQQTLMGRAFFANIPAIA